MEALELRLHDIYTYEKTIRERKGGRYLEKENIFLVEKETEDIGGSTRGPRGPKNARMFLD